MVLFNRLQRKDMRRIVDIQIKGTASRPSELYDRLCLTRFRWQISTACWQSDAFTSLSTIARVTYVLIILQ